MGKFGLRHTRFSHDPKLLSDQVAENARDAALELNQKVTGYFVTVSRYSAAGTTASWINLKGDKLPSGVLCVSAQNVADPGAAVTFSTAVNARFHEGSIRVNEPSGLTANAIYNLRFLVLE